MCDINKPISDEILFGDPDAVLAADREIEELLAEAREDGFEGYDNPEKCTECGEPVHLCKCSMPSFSVAPEAEE